MADEADEKKKDEGPGLGTMFLVSVLGGLTVWGTVELVKYAVDRRRARFAGGGFIAQPSAPWHLASSGPLDDSWEWVE